MSVAEKNLQVVQGGMMPTLNVSNDQKLAAIRDTVAKGASDSEFMMLMHLANTYHLDPFLKEIWFIKYGNTPTIMVSRDGLRNYAMRQNDFLGMISQEVRQGDTFKYNPITGEIHHEIGDGSGPITKCYCIIKREGKPDHLEIIDFKEYYDALSGKNGVWKSHPSAMGKKTVEVLAFKKCYTITGLYAPEEMGMQELTDVPQTPIYDVPSSEPKPSRDPKAEWKAKAKELSEVAVQEKIDSKALREVGAALLEKDDPTKWSIADMNQLIEYLQTKEDERVGDPVAEQDEFELPPDEDLPF